MAEARRKQLQISRATRSAPGASIHSTWRCRPQLLSLRHRRTHALQLSWMMRWITQRNSLIVTLPRPLLSFCPLSLTPLLVSSRSFQDAGSIAHLMPCGPAAPWTVVDPARLSPLASAVHESVGPKVFSHGAQCLEGLVSKNLALSGHPRLTRRLCKIPCAVGFPL